MLVTLTALFGCPPTSLCPSAFFIDLSYLFCLSLNVKVSGFVPTSQANTPVHPQGSPASHLTLRQLKSNHFPSGLCKTQISACSSAAEAPLCRTKPLYLAYKALSTSWPQPTLQILPLTTLPPHFQCL